MDDNVLKTLFVLFSITYGRAQIFSRASFCTLKSKGARVVPGSSLFPLIGEGMGFS
jgi:hypothetical protein